MNIFWIIFYILFVYCVLVYVVSRFVVPFMRWDGFKPPTKVPDEIKAAVADLEIRATDQLSYLEAVYELVLDKNQSQWNHTRFRAALYLKRAFVNNLSEIWETKDFLYCTAINYLVYVMLISSKYFRPEDIKVKHVFVNFFIHQYLKVRAGDKWIDVDPAGSGIRGKPLGNHLSFFG